MFSTGLLFLEKVKTGKLTFDRDGKPSVSLLQHGEVYSFHDQKTADDLLDSLKPVEIHDIKPDTTYMRLFRAPQPVFDSLGELLPPRFITVGFYEIGTELAKITTGSLNQICDKLTSPVSKYFDKPDEQFCPIKQE